MLILVLNLCATVVCADGIYFSKSDQFPTLPYQRAIVAHHQGVQVMVIESTVNAPKEELAWVVPVPNPPQGLALSSPSVFNWAKMRARAKGDPGISSWELGILAILCLSTIAMAAGRFSSPERPINRQTLGWGTALSLLVALLLTILMPVFASRGGDFGVRTIQSEKLGAYDIEVVKGDSADALARWLNKNRFPVPAHATPILDGYVEAGWCFLAAKIDPRKATTGAPMPLVVRFPSKEPIYPMQLTRLSGAPLELELFVIASGSASVSGLRQWATRKLTVYDDPGLFDLDRPLPQHLVSASLTFEGANLTRLRGTLPVKAMQEDFKISLEPPREERVFIREPVAFKSRLLGHTLIAISLGLWFGTFFRIEAVRMVRWTVALVALALLTTFLFYGIRL